MKMFRNLALVCAATFAFTLSACEAPPAGTTNTGTGATATATPQPSATPAMEITDASGAGIAVTLPVLDYLMQSDESFLNDAKTKLSLTDEQINSLKETARTETGKLRAAEGDDYTGSTRAATTQATNQLRQLLGEEKSREFLAFTRTRLSGEEGGNTDGNTMNKSAANTGDARPSSVPSDTRIVVNAPAFRMDLFNNGQLVKSYKVGIGYPEFPLPVGLRRADTIIFNPTWTPPDEPWVEASGKVKVGEKVAAGSKLNPLGPIKIPIGSPSLIHGGKQPARLGNFASHGCVGLTNEGVQAFALELAKLSGAELTPEEVKGYEKQKTETKNYKLPNSIPVELRYETIVVEDGKLRIFRDVYDRDTNTEANARRALEAHGVAFDSLSEQERTRILEALRQMSRDAQGNADTNANSNTNTSNTNANNANANNANAKNANSNSNQNAGGDRVTRNIKGAKEVTIELAALAGKGYPAAIGMEPGTANGKAATQGGKGKRK
jgi:lipoprotein-anchoring transpeptidase ErfK/SrfK